MAFMDELGPELPYLRRYARALTGSQAVGDGFVRDSLMALLEDTSRFDRRVEPRVALFRLFHSIWASGGGLMDAANDAQHDLQGPEARLAAVAPRNREALLLTALEGFTTSEAAQILNVPAGEVEQLIVQAQLDIDQQLATRVLIIEDESVIALHLEHLVTSLGHEVIGVAATHKEAVGLARQHKPGLVLADIQLADSSSGIAAVAEILSEVDVPTIFITAYPERLLTGSRPEPTYLVTKPFVPEAVKAAIGQALFFHAQPVVSS